MYNTADAAVTDEVKAKLPVPAGYRILIAIPKLQEKTDGGVVLPDEMRSIEQTASIVGLVLALGASAYDSKTKFPTGPWCKEGDFVVFRSYSGTRFSYAGQEFRLVNDDTVEAVVDDPRGFKRA